MYLKALDILRVTEAIVESIDEEDDQLDMRQAMMSNAMILAPKIAGAEGGDLYMLRMENAVVIKMNARELQAQTSLLRMQGLSDSEYLQVLRDEIDEFKGMFREWVEGFDPDNNINDGWGIFETPGGE